MKKALIIVLGFGLFVLITRAWGLLFADWLRSMEGNLIAPPFPHAPSQELGLHDWVQVGLSVSLLGASLFVILSTKYGPKDKHWAYGIIGTLVGFWLHP